MNLILGAILLIAAAVAIAAYAGRQHTPRPHVTDERLGHITRYAAAART